MERPRHESARPDEPERHHAPGVHGHGHAHDEGPEHRHPHDHDPAGGHEHAHTLRFERYAYILSPVHDLDPRFKIAGSLALILGAVGGPPLRWAETAMLGALLIAITVLSRVPPAWVLTRSAAVLPLALGIAVFAPLARVAEPTLASALNAYADNGWLVWSIASKAWVSASIVLLLVSTTPLPRLFRALAALRMPDVFLTIVTFLYRFTDVFADQVGSMRRAVASRAPGLSGWRLTRLYGNLAGNLLVRSYERGERIHSAMLSRGYTGVLPSAEVFASGPADWLALATMALAAAALLLY